MSRVGATVTGGRERAASSAVLWGRPTEKCGKRTFLGDARRSRLSKSKLRLDCTAVFTCTPRYRCFCIP